MASSCRCSGSRVAALVFVVSLLVTFTSVAPPCAAARLLLADGSPRAGGEVPYVESSGEKEGGGSVAAMGSGFRGSPAVVAGGRTTATATRNAARVLGSVPSPGVGH